MGITSDFKSRKMKQYPALQPKPRNPRRLFMSYAEALADSNLIKLAREKAKETEEEILKGARHEKASEEASEAKSKEVKENPFVKRAGRQKKQE